MPRYVYQAHVADGFVDDCEELMRRCSQHNPLTFHQFVEIWKEMNLAGIYEERRISAEVAELSEEAIYIAKRYMVADTSNFEESVVGLFLVYGLLNLQPFKGFAPLRLVPDDIPAISRIELVARRDRRLDVLYVLGHVLIKGPAHCHAEPREFGFEPSLRKYLQGCSSLDKFGVLRPKGVFYKQNEELDIIRDLGRLTNQYEEAKARVTDAAGRRDSNLSYADKHLPSKLESSLKRIINGVLDADTKSGEESSVNDARTDRVRDIKQRAMKTVILPRNHRISHADRQVFASTSPRQGADILPTPGRVKSNMLSTPGRVKSNSPKKPVTTGSPRKRKPPNETTKTNKKKKKYCSSDSSDSTVILSDFRDSDDDLDSADDLNKNDDSVNSNEVERIEIEVEDLNNINKEQYTEVTVEKEYDIHINTMPIVITESSSENIEIEFIDNYKKPRASNLDLNDIKEAQSKLIELPGSSVAKSGEGSSKETNNISPQVEKQVKQTVKMSEKLRVRERRELKKPALKSKFKRMGLSNLANFGDIEDVKTLKKANNSK